MKSKHIIIVILLLTGLIFSLYLIITSIVNEEWNTVAASLAVTTAIIGSWSAQRIIWKQEEELEPKLIAYLDLKSRKGVTFFVIENIGGSSAYDVKIVWEKAMFNRKNEEVHFSSGVENIDFRCISKGQRFSYFVNITLELYQKYNSSNELLDFWGKIKFKKKKNTWFESSDDFFVSLEPHRTSLDTEDELQGFLHEGAKLHKDMIEIDNSLKKIVSYLKPKE